MRFIKKGKPNGENVIIYKIRENFFFNNWLIRWIDLQKYIPVRHMQKINNVNEKIWHEDLQKNMKNLIKFKKCNKMKIRFNMKN